MNELVSAIKAWPVIVQGALGSALFWLVLVFAQWARMRISIGYSHHSKYARMSWLINQQAKLHAYTAKSDIQTIEGLNWIFYRASRPFLKSLMWVVFGLMMNGIAEPAGLIGYIIALTYLFKAYDVIGPINEKDPATRLKEVENELHTLDSDA